MTDERVILTDLIAELRDGHPSHPYVLPLTPQSKERFCGCCQADYPCPSVEAADRAERRLREVQGE